MADVSKIKLPNGTTYNIKDTVSGYITVNDIPKEIYTVKIDGTVNWSEVKQAFEDGKVIIGVLDDSGSSDGLGEYSILSEIYYDKNSAYGIDDYMVFATFPPMVDNGAIDNAIVVNRWVPDNGGTWERYDSSIVSQVTINGSSIVDWGVANIVTNTAYNSSSNKIATVTDINNAMTVVTFTPNQTTNNLIISVQQPSSITNGNEVSY